MFLSFQVQAKGSILPLQNRLTRMPEHPVVSEDHAEFCLAAAKVGQHLLQTLLDSWRVNSHGALTVLDPNSHCAGYSWFAVLSGQCPLRTRAVETGRADDVQIVHRL